jgi:predicted Zn-dependent protease with MMP-like domain
VPLSATRAERFDDIVLDAVDQLEQRWSAELSGVEFAVEDVPPADQVVDSSTLTLDTVQANDGLLDEDEHLDTVPLSRLQPASGMGRSVSPPRIVVYRRPIEARASDPEDLADLVFDVLVHEVARLLDVEPEVVDPEGHGYLDE